MSKEDYAYLARLLRSYANGDRKILHALFSNNLNTILAALDIASGADERVTRLMVGIDEDESGL